MSEEAAFSVTKNFHTIRGNTLLEFQQNVEALLGEGSYARMVESFQEAYGVSLPQAAVVVQQAFPQAAPVSTVGVVAQPTPVAQPVAPQPPVTQPAPAAPPTVGQGGMCAHGPRVYKSQKTAKGQWNRWECAIPWTKGADNSGRCEAVNV